MRGAVRTPKPGSRAGLGEEAAEEAGRRRLQCRGLAGPAARGIPTGRGDRRGRIPRLEVGGLKSQRLRPEAWAELA